MHDVHGDQSEYKTSERAQNSIATRAYLRDSRKGSQVKKRGTATAARLSGPAAARPGRGRSAPATVAAVAASRSVEASRRWRLAVSFDGSLSCRDLLFRFDDKMAALAWRWQS